MPEVATKLKPGMSTTAVITTATVENVLTVPLQAIVPRELPGKEGENNNQSGGPNRNKEVDGVFVITRDNLAQFKQITTGIKGDQEIELKSGVEDGEEIIVGPYKTLRTLKDGDRVKREAKPTGPETK
jgi:HlyD family secretion protein